MRLSRRQVWVDVLVLGRLPAYRFVDELVILSFVLSLLQIDILHSLFIKTDVRLSFAR